MILRKNRLLVEEYLQYGIGTARLTTSSAEANRRNLTYVLEWAGERSFLEVSDIRPFFAEYLKTARRDGKEGHLSPEYLRRIVSSTKGLFDWLHEQKPGYAAATTVWLRDLRPPRVKPRRRKRNPVTLRQARDMAKAPARTPRERRARASAAFLYE
jgi:integrase